MVIIIQDVQVEQVVELEDKKSDGVFLFGSDGGANRRVVAAESQDRKRVLSPVSTPDSVETNESTASVSRGRRSR